MALLDIFRNIGEKMGKGMERNIGGLLGVDPESLTPEERKQARRLSQMAVFDALARGTTPTAGIQSAAALLGAQREERSQRQRQKAAEEEMQRISAMTFGGAGPTGQKLETLVEGEEPYQMTRYFRQDPKEALRRMYGTSAGRDVAQIAPGLLKTAEEMSAPDDYVYQSVSGVGLVAVNKKDPSDMRIVQAERSRGGPSERFKILSPAEAKANNLPAGIVYQQNLVTKQITPMQTGGAGGLSDTDVRQYRTAKIGIQNARGQMQNLQSVLEEVPPYKAIAGEGRGKLEASYSLALSAIRQLQNSGVLNVGELPFLEKALADPTSFSAIATSPIQRGKLKGQIDTVMKLLDQQEQTLKTQYGMDGASENEPTASSIGVPAPSMAGGRRGRKPGAEAVKRAEGYY